MSAMGSLWPSRDGVEYRELERTRSEHETHCDPFGRLKRRVEVGQLVEFGAQACKFAEYQLLRRTRKLAHGEMRAFPGLVKRMQHEFLRGECGVATPNGTVAFPVDLTIPRSLNRKTVKSVIAEVSYTSGLGVTSVSYAPGSASVLNFPSI